MRVILLMAALLTLTACGTAAEQKSQVVSLETTGSTPASNSGEAAKDERPRGRLDSTPEEAKRLMEPHTKCMNENGIPSGRGKEGPWLSDEEYKRIWPVASEKCKKFWPLPAWEIDKNNPESMDYIHRVVECLRGHGAKVEERPAGPGEDVNGFAYVGDNSHLGNDTLGGMALTDKCQRESLRK